MRHILCAATTLLLSACAVGPDFRPPAVPSEAASSFVTMPSAVTADDPDNRWWQLYRDPVLDALIAQALAANTDIRVAVARLDRARAALEQVSTQQLPQPTLNGSARYGKSSVIDTIPPNPREGWRVDTGIDLAYEVDLFGRIRRNVEAAYGDAIAAQEDVDAVRVAVAAETTRAYADAASAAAHIAVARRIIELLDRSVGIAAQRAEVGLTTELEPARLAALRDQRRADLASIEAERRTALFRLATLIGKAPAALPQAAAARNTVLTVSQPIPVGDGARLLARRPDVRAAEQRLAAATARIGVVTAELYPKISFGGSVGSTGGVDDIFGAGAMRWIAGPLISWDLNLSRTRARIAGAEADQRAALANFDGTVLRALQETETALASYAQMLERQKALRSARDEAEHAARITRAQRQEGSIDSLVALDAERTLAQAEAESALTDARIADAQVDLFRALGGRWVGASRR